RYEFNREYEDRLKAAGLRITGETPDNTYVEICEIGDHPWFLGCQFHPEFKSKPMEPHPLFKAFIGASYGYRRRRMTPLVQQDVPEEGDVPQEEVPQEAEVPRESAEAPREEPQYSRAT